MWLPSGSPTTKKWAAKKEIFQTAKLQTHGGSSHDAQWWPHCSLHDLNHTLNVDVSWQICKAPQWKAVMRLLHLEHSPALVQFIQLSPAASPCSVHRQHLVRMLPQVLQQRRVISMSLLQTRHEAIVGSFTSSQCTQLSCHKYAALSKTAVPNRTTGLRRRICTRELPRPQASRKDLYPPYLERL